MFASQEVREFLPDADVNPHMERCPIAPYNTIKSTDLQALVRLIRSREDECPKLDLRVRVAEVMERNKGVNRVNTIEDSHGNE